MSGKAIRLLLLASLLTFPAAPVSATTTGFLLDLALIAKNADVIFAGTVDSVRYAMDPAGETALTRVYFGKVVYAKGTPRSEPLALTLRGGKTARDESFVVGQPEFEWSKRYIVMAHAGLGSKENLYLPIIGLDAGFFRVIPDHRAGIGGRVYDGAYRPVAQIKGHHLVVIDGGVPSVVRPVKNREAGGEPPIELVDPSEDPGWRVDEGEFLRAVRALGK